MKDRVGAPRVPFRNVVMTGFMGRGKTTVGRALATQLGWRFVDTDRTDPAEASRAVLRKAERVAETPGRRAAPRHSRGKR
jgi:shikimate kinase